MKFNWGTGILIFLILFLIAAGIFIAFAMRQSVELVHEDYYERGVDHSTQMEVERRSAPYQEAIKAVQLDGALQISMTDTIAVKCDSAMIKLYRPSDNQLDMNIKYDPGRGALVIPNEKLVPGRYILTLSWYSGGLKYEADCSLNIH